MGHEYSGVITKVGKNVKGWKEGERVTVNPGYMCGECYWCRHGYPSQCEHFYDGFYMGKGITREFAGGFAKFVGITVPERRLYRIPDNVSFEEAALTEVFASTLHAVRVSDFKAGDDTMVIGAGPVGLATIANLKNAGACLIIATEIVDSRAELARRFGADYVFNPQEEANLPERVLEITRGKGIDRLFQCSANIEAFRTGPNFIRRGGQIMVVDCIEEPWDIAPTQWCYNEWDVKGALCYYYDEYPMVLEFMRKGLLPAKEMITKKISIDDFVKEGIEVLLDPKRNTEVKILVKPE